MAFDLQQLMAERAAEKFPLFDRYLNSQLVRVLKTIGYDVDYVKGEGPYLFDAKGERYLDLLSGFGVFAMGRNHPTVAAALRQVLDAQMAGMVQMDVSLLAGLLAETLCSRLPWLDKAFFCNSGAEAVEGAIKFARAATRRSKIVYCDHAFHGLTLGALSLNGDGLFRGGFEPLLSACAQVPFNDLLALERALAGNDVAAFIFEPVQGKGVNLPDDGYLAEAQRLCRKHGTLFVADEIQSGLGRTGRFVASEHWGLEPDMVLFAKALSGGFVPVGAIVMRKAIFDKMFDRMDRAVVHGSTFSKNDMAMAAGLATLAVMDEEKLSERAAGLGERLIADLRRRLGGFEFVKAVRGKGMMIAIEFGPPKSLKLKAAYAMLDKANKGLFCQLILIPLFKRHRILAQVAGHNMPVIKLLPPLVISEADATWIADAFEDVIGESHALGAVWDLGRTLAGHALKTRAGAA
ncbi:MAG: aspartate aminotransferase family protein [Defluviicoccus sp.]|nr:MAG: aspartate aminotransferase family protein [Defluviicoccus sp.]